MPNLTRGREGQIVVYKRKTGNVIGAAPKITVQSIRVIYLNLGTRFNKISLIYSGKSFF